MGLTRWPCLLLLLVTGMPALAAGPSDERFDEANDLALAGDYPKAIAIYTDLATSGHESASLYWNWAQVSSARGAQGEALWALLRARELEPGDRAVRRDVHTLRDSMNLDPAEIAPEPLAGASRLARRYRLDLVAIFLLGLSLLAHGAHRLGAASRWTVPVAWAALTVGLLAAAAPVAGTLARSTWTVIRRGAPLLDSAAASAEAIGALREGEVVPILEPSGDWLRVEDASGARGWAHVSDVRRLDIPPPARSSE